ncbi:MAG: hypothetical protein U9Q07_03365, partial [Planctomycetota bacterium]|nr:hypothetical protein [Planctomycetota bacterium]
TPSAGDRSSAELAKFSTSKNVRTERAVADANYSNWARTLDPVAPATKPADDDNPNTTPPDAADRWDLSGFWGINGYVKITGGVAPSVSVELWCLDSGNNYFFKVAETHSLRTAEEFHFDGQVRGRICFLRIFNINDAAITKVELVVSPE